jgi:hypothetical protein
MYYTFLLEYFMPYAVLCVKYVSLYIHVYLTVVLPALYLNVAKELYFISAFSQSRVYLYMGGLYLCRRCEQIRISQYWTYNTAVSRLTQNKRGCSMILLLLLLFLHLFLKTSRVIHPSWQHSIFLIVVGVIIDINSIFPKKNGRISPKSEENWW